MTNWFREHLALVRSRIAKSWHDDKVLVVVAVASAIMFVSSLVANAYIVSFAVVLLWLVIGATTTRSRRPRLIRRQTMSQAKEEPYGQALAFGLPRYIAKQMVASEDVLVAEHLHILSVLRWLLLGGVGAIIAILGLATAYRFPGGFLLVGGALMAISGWKYLVYRRIWIIQTTVRIVRFSGVFTRVEGALPVSKIDSIAYREGFLSARILSNIGWHRYGTLTIETAAEVEALGKEIKYVLHPDKFRAELWEAIANR